MWAHFYYQLSTVWWGTKMWGRSSRLPLFQKLFFEDFWPIFFFFLNLFSCLKSLWYLRFQSRFYIAIFTEVTTTFWVWPPANRNWLRRKVHKFVYCLLGFLSSFVIYWLFNSMRNKCLKSSINFAIGICMQRDTNKINLQRW